MPYGFETVVECLRNAKTAAIEQGVHIGKKHPTIKYPLFAIMVVFIFAYNFFLHVCIQMHHHKSFSKGLAYVLTIALVVSNVSVIAFADDNETVPEKIIAFSELPSDIAQQTIFIGDDESKITFPSSLGVTIERTEVITTKTKIEKTTEEKYAIDNEDSEQIKNQEQDPLSKELTEEEIASDGTSSDSEKDAEEINAEQGSVEIPSSDISNESAQEIETESESVEDATEINKQSEESEEGNSSAEETTPDDQALGIFNIIMPSITVYAAEPDTISEEVDSIAEEDAEYEITKEAVTSSEETIIEGISWSLDAESSSVEVFSSEVAGTRLVYVPVLCGDYSIANDLPQITVYVVEKEEKIETVSFSHSESVAGYNISIDAPAGVFPEGTTVSINVVSNPLSLIEGEISEERDIQQIITFDISFWHDGVEIEPDNGKVNVSINLAHEMKNTLQENSAEVQVFHIDDSRNIEEVSCSSNGEEVSFSTSEFSKYALVASVIIEHNTTNDGIIYVTDGDNIIITGYEGTATELTIPATINGMPVTNIAQRAFENSGLVSVVIEYGIETIEDWAFANSKNLTNVVIPASVIFIHGRAFSGTPYYNTLSGNYIVDGDGVLTKYNGDEAQIIIPDGVKVIADYVFAGKSLSSVIIPDSVIEIGQGAFDSCNNLTTIDLPNSIKHIGYGAFCMSGITSITIPSSVESMGDDVFLWCSNLADIVVDSNNAFYCSLDGVLYNKNCTELIRFPAAKIANSYAVPNGVEKVRFRAFQGCSKVSEVVFPSTLKAIGSSTFQDSNITWRVLPGGDDVIVSRDTYVKGTGSKYSDAFWVDSCDAETYVIKNESGTVWKAIAPIAFGWQSGQNLKYVELPDTIEYIDIYAFNHCSSLERVKLSSNLKTIDEYAFSGCCLNEINIPSSVTRIGQWAFSGNKFSSIELSESITTLDTGTFWKCKELERIVIPNSVTSIGQRCFEDCSSLGAVYIPNTVNYIGEDAFNECYLLTIFAPKGSYAIEYAKNNSIKYIEVDAVNARVINGSGSGVYVEDDVVFIAADKASAGKRFKQWIISSGNVQIDNIASEKTSIVIGDSDVTIEATYEDIEYNVIVTNGTGSGKYTCGSTVTIKENNPATGKLFSGWTVKSGGITLADSTKQETTFTMPAGDVEVEATYVDMPTKCIVKVINGTGSGEYAIGKLVIAKANVPPRGQKFKGWRLNKGIVELINSDTRRVSFKAVAGEIEIEALFGTDDNTEEEDDSSIETSGNIRADNSLEAEKNLLESLTDEQIQEASGHDVGFVFEENEVDENAEGATDIKNIASSLGAIVLNFFDLQISVTLDGTPKWTLSTLQKPTTATVTVPDDYYTSDRVYIVFRYHDGDVVEVGRGKGKHIPITTDKFSTYSLAYVNDDINSSEVLNSSKNTENNADSGSKNLVIWTPKTPDEIKRYSAVGTETLKPFVDKSSGYTLTMKNAMQGPSCFTAFESVLNGYTIGRTYDIFPNGQRVQSTDKEVGFSIEIPKALQKEGRMFQMICVTKGGQPIVLKDLDSSPNTITVKTNKFYAFALVYKDPVTTR